MIDTPRTDKALWDDYDPVAAVGELCHKLELELNAAKAKIQRLVEAGDVLSRTLNMPVYHVGMVEHSREEWTKAKEGL